MPSETFVGQREDGRLITTYFAKDGPVLTLGPLASVNAVPSAAQNALLSSQLSAAYWTQGQSVDIHAPAMTNYTVIGSSTATVTLGQQQGTHTFIYIPPVTSVDLSTVPPPAGAAIDRAITSGIVQTTSPTGPCSNITAATPLSSAGIKAPDSTHTIVGGVRLTMQCTAPSSSSSLQFVLGRLYADVAGTRVYRSSPNGIIDITDLVTVSNQVVAGSLRTVVTFTLQDGSSSDMDALANGAIESTLYIGVPPGSLASTGQEQAYLVVIASGVIALGILMLVSKRYII